MNARDVMSGEVHLLDPGTTVRDAAKQMRDADVGALPIGENDRLTGMVTDRDIAMRCVAGDKDPDKSIVDEIKSEEIYYCYDYDNVEQIADTMAAHRVRRLPVIDADKRMVGIVSLADLVKAGVAHRALEGVSEQSHGSRD